MELVKPEQQEQYEALTKVRGKLNISKNNPKQFTYGTIVEDPRDIKDNSEYTFCVFRVGVGKSYCHKVEKDEAIESITLKDGYDSVYIENPPNSRIFQMNYIVYSSDNVVLTHVIKCRIDILEFQGSLDKPLCKICDNLADVFCEND